MEIYVKNIFYFHMSLFLVFKHYFIRCIYFTRIAALSTASDDARIKSHIEYLI